MLGQAILRMAHFCLVILKHVMSFSHIVFIMRLTVISPLWTWMIGW